MSDALQHLREQCSDNQLCKIATGDDVGGMAYDCSSDFDSDGNFVDPWKDAPRETDKELRWRVEHDLIPYITKVGVTQGMMKATTTTTDAGDDAGSSEPGSTPGNPIIVNMDLTSHHGTLFGLSELAGDDYHWPNGAMKRYTYNVCTNGLKADMKDFQATIQCSSTDNAFLPQKYDCPEEVIPSLLRGKEYKDLIKDLTWRDVGYMLPGDHPGTATKEMGKVAERAKELAGGALAREKKAAAEQRAKAKAEARAAKEQKARDEAELKEENAAEMETAGDKIEALSEATASVRVAVSASSKHGRLSI